MLRAPVLALIEPPAVDGLWIPLTELPHAVRPNDGAITAYKGA
jgi:hypothetical protein